MIIQKVIKGMSGQMTRDEAIAILRRGIRCRWWQQVNPLPAQEIVERLTERNLRWHQNYYEEPDPLQGNRPFCERTPFISTTAGTVERDAIFSRNVMMPAWLQALSFATDSFREDTGYLYYCYLFVIGKQAISHEGFAEELRELNIYTGFSPFHPEGEITAKIIIPPPQIEKVEYWSLSKIINDLYNGQSPSPDDMVLNPLYAPAEDYSNVRELLEESGI